jgi:hypothetical protein
LKKTRKVRVTSPAPSAPHGPIFILIFLLPQKKNKMKVLGYDY